jgi:hypothetical protein
MTQPAQTDKPKRAKKVAAPETKIVKSIKGTDVNLQCRGFQFELGKEYSTEGRIIACENGFHACPVEHHPFSVFDYYAPAGSRFFEVSQSGSGNPSGNKLASATIRIDFELTIGDLVKRAWEYVWARATKTDEAHVAGTQGAASSTGYQGAASSTGDQGAASSTGTQGAASSTGYQGAASSTGYRGAASSTGDQGAASSTGYQGAAMASGYYGRVMGAAGNALFSVERDANYNILSVAAGIVGQDGIEAGKWYRAAGGKLVLA